MRSYSALALLSALITVCLGAQSDRSRQRSSPVRSVPVAADIKRDADFDCPEEFGYYPHPTDCTLYYVCVFGGALLESCTGGLMYSHELQTCDWPRNVGCDGASVIGGDELERLNEREPPRRKSTSPRRTPPPPPPRAQPNPVITSRGQPRYNRDQYEKQQQLYAEVDDLPPVEEIESDRQQRVYRGQPSTIGQVQKDRDGYVSQPANSGRNLNSNIIPASLSQSSKYGSFSFGSQVDERRTATVTPVPQSYSEDNAYVTDFHPDRQLDIKMNVIDITDNDLTNKPPLRRKREATEKDVGTNETVTITNSKRSDTDTEIEYVELNPKNVEINNYEIINNEMERGKRQVRYFLKDGYNGSGKNWLDVKNINANNFHQVRYNPNSQNIRYQPVYTDSYNTNYFATDHRPTSFENNLNTFLSYRPESLQTQKHFKPSQADPSYSNYAHSTGNIATQVVTRSPPISSLNNNDNLFYSLAGGFYNNSPRPSSNYKSQLSSEVASSGTRPNNPISFLDSSLLPSTVVTGKPVIMPTSIPTTNSHRSNSNQINNNANPSTIPFKSGKLTQNPNPNQQKDENYDDEDSLEYDESSSDEEEDSDQQYKNHFPKPPYEFTHPNNKYANIENPFANPDFDFDAFLSKLSNGQYTPKPKSLKEASTPSNFGITLKNTHLNYKGMSTPKPFTGSAAFVSTPRPNDGNVRPHGIVKQSQLYSQFEQSQPSQLPYYHQQQSLNQNGETKFSHETAGTPLDAIRPKLKPPNFKDDRELPLTYSFSTIKPKYNETKYRDENQQAYLVTQKPYIIISSTGAPIILSSPKYQHIVKPEKVLTLQPYAVATSKPYLTSSIKPFTHQAFKQSTQKPLTTIANEQLSALRNYWQNPSTIKAITQSATPQPTTTVDYAKLGNLFAQAVRSSTQIPIKNHNVFNNELKNLLTTTKSPSKRRPIPKPSPEMNDYYYDDEDDQYYYEPVVKPKYMPSTEVRPQRPPMAQNYKEYEDNYEVFEDQRNINVKPPQLFSNTEIKYNSYKPIADTKNYNNISVVTKSSLRDMNKNTSGKILVPVLVEYASVRPSVLIRPEVSNYEIVQHNLQNRTTQYKKPSNLASGPYTIKPPKYLNQTTLRPYTVRHRLAKPTTVSGKKSATQNDDAQNKGRTRHQNIVAQMKLSIPKDNYNQETRYSKIKHDDKTNSLEPTESVAPVSYSPSPRPKMLYNGSQNYNPDQYDPFYAVYDEDGELYKDADYVQQYNVASLRPAVQQTYRGTPPPSRRPTENYTPRPVVRDDYDDALTQGQLSNQNQYQSPVRHPTRGEGNELGYDHNPSSVRTTLYEATSISTIPPTSSTSTTTTTTTTTTQRSTTAQFTEAMTPSRYTPRLSTNEKPTPKPETSTNPPVIEPASLAPSTASTIINFSSLAKPFEKTDNFYRLRSTLPTTENKLTSRQPSIVTNNNNKISVETTQPVSNPGTKKVLSLTSGFSIRRNVNNTNNPYTLTVLTRPLDEYNQLAKIQDSGISNSQLNSGKYYHGSNSGSVKNSSSNSASDSDEYLKFESTSESAFVRHDTVTRINYDYDIPIYTRPVGRSRGSTKPTVEMTSPLPVTTTSVSTTPMPRTTPTSLVTKTLSPVTKYYIKTISKRPSPSSSPTEENRDSTENAINIETLIETAQENQYDNSNSNYTSTEESFELKQHKRHRYILNNPTVSPYRTLDNLRKTYKNNFVQDYTTSTITTPPFTTTTRKQKSKHNTKKHSTSESDLSYYSYHVEDDVIPDQTTEIFSGKVKHVIQAFLNNLITTPAQLSIQEYSTTTPVSTKVSENEKIANPLKDQGNQGKVVQHFNDKGIKHSNFDITELPIIDSNIEGNSSPSSVTMPVTNIPTVTSTFTPRNIRTRIDNTKDVSHNIEMKDLSTSKFSDFIKDVSEQTLEDVTVGKVQSKFHNLFNKEYSTEPIIQENTGSDILSSTKYSVEAVTPLSLGKSQTTSEPIDIASTTSTTKSTTTEILESTTKTSTTTSKSISFPTRPSRVNPAIKLAVTNIGSGRRSYQSSSKCSTDNSLQANPKCNEIKYQRPTTTRGRGSAHYSKSGGSDAQQPAPNRGTPPTRSRPTLKPSTAIVSKSTEFIDIYAHPPSRPAPVYPQPTLDKTAAKCRKDVCLLPDCYCGGKDIPGDLPVESVPQIVLLTFDDSVNDLNKGLYADLFEKGRVNPNGCPISATFYVSHEWTDYSQVQNLYSAGHEMASHTISHSFGEQFSQKKWNREVAGQREILAAYGGVKLEDVRGMRAPFLSVGGNKMFKMLYDSNFTYDSSLPVYENRPPSWPYTLDYKLFHDCMIPPCPTKSYPGVWEVPMVMWQDLNGGRCSMGDACANPPEAENVYKMILKNFDRHYTTNRAPFGLFYHAAWFTQPHHKEGFIMFLDFINQMPDVWIVTNWQALQWVRDPTPISRLNNFQPFQCNYQDRPKKCNNPKVCNLWHKSGVRYMRTCQPCPEIYPWTGKSGIRSSRIDNDNGE